MKVCVLTSCIIPNTEIGVSSLTTQQRLNDLFENARFLHRLGIFDLLLIADPSLIEPQNPFRQSLVSWVDQLQANATKTGIRLLFPLFTDEQSSAIQSKGKGYSELLILKAAVESLRRESLGVSVLFKISARYRIINMRYLVASMLRRHQQGKGICVEVNRISKKVNTVFFSFLPDCLDIIVALGEFLDDSKGVFVEGVFYRKIFLAKRALISRVGPFVYAFSLSSGSKKLTYGLLAQLPRIAASFI